MSGRSDGVEAARLGAYAARSCAVRAQWDIVRPVEPEPDPPFLVALGQQGIAFEEDVDAELLALHPDAVVVEPTLPAEEREARTLDALGAGARLVIGPRLAHDPETRRVGAPDLLVRVGAAGYVPVDVKHHAAIEDPEDLRGVADLAGIDADGPARPADARAHDAAREDLLQLAHYWRMLERLGHAADGRPRGAIVGRERKVVRFDLDEPRLRVDGELLSALALYDLAYAERVRVVEAAEAHVRDRTLPLARVPVWFSECPDCPWRAHCRQYLEARQDVSLLPRVGVPQWRALAAVGADTMPALATLPADATVEGVGPATLTNAVAHARARLATEVAFRRPGVDRVVVERGDVELDVDMENVEGGACLWGVHVTDRAGSGIVEDGYLPFVDWDPDATHAGGVAFEALWTWLTQLRRDCAARGLTLRAYCWSEAAENRWLREGARATVRGEALVDEVEAFIGSEEWVDLMRVFGSQVITGYGQGLKTVAPMLGFAWRDDDPSGAASMLWWEEAVDETIALTDRERVRARILDYNADDVRATLHVRDWLTEHGPGLGALS